MWEKMLDALKAFKLERGHSAVPGQPQHAHLRGWVVSQKKLFADSKQGMDTALELAAIRPLDKTWLSFSSRKRGKAG